MLVLSWSAEMAVKTKHRWLPSRRILLLLGFMVKVLHADLVSRCSEECAVTLVSCLSSIFCHFS